MMITPQRRQRTHVMPGWQGSMDLLDLTLLFGLWRHHGKPCVKYSGWHGV